MPPARVAPCSGEPRLWQRPKERSSTARPPPSDKRRHQSRSGSGEGPGLGGCGPTSRGQGAEPRPAPHLLATSFRLGRAGASRFSDHPDPAPAGHQPPVPDPGPQTPPLGEFRLSCAQRIPSLRGGGEYDVHVPSPASAEGILLLSLLKTESLPRPPSFVVVVLLFIY